MSTQPQLLLLQKTMVVVEGVARKLNPDTNIWEVSKTNLENWIKEVKSPKSTVNKVIINTSEENYKEFQIFLILLIKLTTLFN